MSGRGLVILLFAVCCIATWGRVRALEAELSLAFAERVTPIRVAPIQVSPISLWDRLQARRFSARFGLPHRRPGAGRDPVPWLWLRFVHRCAALDVGI